MAPAPSSPFATVAVIGCGMIGGSLALAAGRMPGVERVVVSDRDPAVRDLAARKGMGDVASSAVDAVLGADLVIVATPADAVPGVVAEVWQEMPPGGVLTDVASVKSQVMVEVEALRVRIGQDLPAFIGGHPMAGSEGSGLAAADATIFQGATYVLSPTGSASPESFNRLSGFVRALGARVLAIDPATHDRVVALVSHLPQVVASAMMAVAAEAADDEPGVLAAAGGGFRDVTRVAGSDAELWVGILRQNREAVLDALDRLGRRLGSVAEAVRSEDWDAVHGFLVAGREARARIPGKEVTGPVIDLVIPVQDRAGSLATVTTALGSAGINIEDLSMRHAAGQGALLVSVQGREAAERARTVLEERGYASHLEER